MGLNIPYVYKRNRADRTCLGTPFVLESESKRMAAESHVDACKTFCPLLLLSMMLQLYKWGRVAQKGYFSLSHMHMMYPPTQLNPLLAIDTRAVGLPWKALLLSLF